MALHYGSMISVTNVTHVAASATGLSCLESSCLFKMLTTHFLMLIAAIMLQMRLCLAGIQKQHGSPCFLHHIVLQSFVTSQLCCNHEDYCCFEPERGSGRGYQFDFSISFVIRKWRVYLFCNTYSILIVPQSTLESTRVLTRKRNHSLRSSPLLKRFP